MAIDASDRPNDRFGYSVYAVVIPAPPAVSGPVAELRARVGPERAMIPAHVTVLGTFCDVEDLDGITTLVARATARSRPFNVDLSGSLWDSPDGRSAGLRVAISSEIRGLHDALSTAVLPLVTDAYGAEEFRPHLTLYQAVPADQVNEARRQAEAMRLDGFRANAVELVGRVGPAFGGEWRLIRRFNLGPAEPSDA